MEERIRKLRAKLDELEGAFRLDHLKTELASLDTEMARPDFWGDPRKAAGAQRRRSYCVGLIDLLTKLAGDLEDAKEFAPMAEAGDADISRELAGKLDGAAAKIEELEFRRMFSGELDASSAIVSVNSGAGGTEAQDWVQMLLRMYLRWAERKGFQAAVVDSLPGEGAGFKNVTFTVDGSYAYGYLHAEAGIHRLVRISPFDANARRHTSFASVLVMPQLDDDIDIQVEETDLRIDTFRSSGAGGQHVNKTDSAVRLTHIPSGIVVTCQNERSQHKNKAQAMKILRARLYEKEHEERGKEREKLAGEKKEIGFGSQIRSYTLQPYQLIKDHRTDFEVGNVQAVLDGELDGFIRSYLLKKSSGSFEPH
ncbi:MAG: peptide chain release factor 2 [Pseudomonadota bacterium]